MGATAQYDLAGIDLTDDQYTVEQNLVRNKYEALDASGATVLTGKQKLFKMKEEFPFVDPAGNEVFTVNAASIVDVAGNYVLSDAQTGEDLVVLDNEYNLYRDTWTIRDAASGATLASIESRGLLVALARRYVPFGTLIPYEYEITTRDGDHVGRIDGQFGVRDRYDISIHDDSEVPTEPVVAAAMVIDAIQNR